MKARLLGAALVALLLAITEQAALAETPPNYMVFFDQGRSSLSSQAGNRIADFVHWYKFRRDTWQVTVYGHTDTEESSELLSQARAEAVRQRLVELGIPLER
ncbi:MAG: OmpA family protein, partial [Alphaproteobacteria bacterium]|nr:OmpA family protein [Alphaproteobacteria bacterium]